MLGESPSEPGPEMTQVGRGKVRRFQTGVRGLIVVVACCAFIAWSARSLWESQHPAVAAAHGLQSADPARRARATRELTSAGETDPVRAIPPLIDALRDPEAEVRVATIVALGAIGGEAARGGSAWDAVAAAVAGLMRSLKDPVPAVRIAAMNALVRIAYGRGPAGPIDPKVIVRRPRHDAARPGRWSPHGGSGRAGDLRSGRPSRPAGAASRGPGASIGQRSGEGRQGRRQLPLQPGSVASFPPPKRRARRGRGPQCLLGGFLQESAPGVLDGGDPRAGDGARESSPGRSSRRRLALEPHARDPQAAVAIPGLLTLLKESIDRDRRLPDAWDSNLPIGFNDLDAAMLATRILARMAPGTKSAREVVAALASLVRSDDPMLREAAVSALGEFGPAAEPAVPALVQILRGAVGKKDDADAFEGQSAARVLAKIAPGTKSASEVIAALTEVVRSDHPVRWGWAAEALGEFGPAAEPAVPAIILRLAGGACRNGQGSPLRRIIGGQVAGPDRPGDEVGRGCPGGPDRSPQLPAGGTSQGELCGHRGAAGVRVEGREHPSPTPRLAE